MRKYTILLLYIALVILYVEIVYLMTLLLQDKESCICSVYTAKQKSFFIIRCSGIAEVLEDCCVCVGKMLMLMNSVGGEM